MIPDKVKLFFVDIDHVIITFFTMFFLSEPALMYMLPIAYWFIPVSTLASKFVLVWLLPDKAGKFLHFIMLVAISIIGYVALMYVAPSTLWFSMTMIISMVILLTLQFTGTTPDAEDRIRTRIEHKEELLQQCNDIELENKDI